MGERGCSVEADPCFGRSSVRSPEPAVGECEEGVLGWGGLVGRILVEELEDRGEGGEARGEGRSVSVVWERG